MKGLILTFLFCTSLVAQDSGLHTLSIIPTPDKSAVGNLNFMTRNRLHSIGLAAPDSATSNLLFRLPAINNPGCMANDGFLNLSFGPCGGSNSIIVSPANPIYLYSHFQDDDTVNGRLSYSMDGVNFKPIRKEGSFLSTYGEIRDPSITYDPLTSMWIIVGSPPASDPSKIQIYRSADLINWSTSTTIEINTSGIVPGAVAIYAPEWFRNPLDGKLYLIMAVSLDHTTFYPFFSEYDPTTNAIVSTTSVSLSPTAINQTIDYYLYYDDDSPAIGSVAAYTGTHKFYLFYVDTDLTGGNFYQQISYAVSSSFLGPYTAVTEVSSPTSSDQFKFTKYTEAPSVFKLPNGHIRIVADTWTDLFNNYGPGLLPRKYAPKYQDVQGTGSDPFSSNLITDPPYLNIGRSEHGTILKITDQTQANMVFNAAAKFGNDIGEAGGLVVGDTSKPARFPLHVRVRGAHQFLQNTEPAEMALESGDGSLAVISSCGVGTYSCPASSDGKSKVVIAHSGSGDSGSIQLNNTNVDTGQTSILFGNGIGVYGDDPQTRSASGNRSLWDLSTNNQYFGSSTVAHNNTANNWFSLYNRGLGATIGTALTVVNSGFDTNLTSWTIPGSMTASRSTTTVFEGAGSISMTAGSGEATQTITGAIAGTTYTLNAWLYTTDGGGFAASGYMWSDDGASGNFAGIAKAVNTAGEWRKISVNFVATSTGNMKLYLGRANGTGTIFWDSVNVETLRIGSFPLGISSESGEVRANYGFTLGIGDASSLDRKAYGSVSSAGAGIIAMGNGKLGDRSAIVLQGYSDVTKAFTLNGENINGVETRHLQVQRIEPGTNTVPGGTSYTLPAVGATTIFSDTGPGNVTQLQIAMIGSSNPTMLDTRLVVTVDGVIAMNVDLGTFFLTHGSSGGGAASGMFAQLYANENRAFYHFADGDSFGAMRRIFIPYTTSCTISLSNGGATTPNLYTQVDYYNGAVPVSRYGENRKVFHTVTTEVSSTTLTQFSGIDLLPLVTLPAGVTGQLESIDQVVFKGGTGFLPTWLEGDPTLTADGVNYQYGGTEDFFGGQFYWDQLAVRNKDHGVGHLGPASGIVLTSFYRYFPDPLTFNSTLQYKWFNGQPAQAAPPGTVNVGGLVIYYTSQ